MHISLCLAVYNEEKNLHYAMDSTVEWVDEVILVDGGSTDKTVTIASSYGHKVKVISTDNPPMFHINKQKAIEAASGDWILQLDADEAVPDELRKEILAVTSRQGGEVAYKMPRKNWFLSRFLTKGGQYPDYTIRLYRKGAAHFPCKDVHENVEVSGAIGELKEPLLHYSDLTFDRYLTRWNRYTTLEAQRIVEGHKKNNIRTGWAMAIEYCVVKPIATFLLMYVRLRGYVDGFPGFVFAFFSSLRFIPIYIKVKTGNTQ